MPFRSIKLRKPFPMAQYRRMISPWNSSKNQCKIDKSGQSCINGDYLLSCAMSIVIKWNNIILLEDIEDDT